jgi:glycosyltransferase involved in cell wall biosynthesis
VPLINRPSYRRHLYLEDGTHCFYYDADRDSVAERVVALLAEKPRLSRMAEEGRRYVLAHHTRPAVARYILNELEAVP